MHATHTDRGLDYTGWDRRDAPLDASALPAAAPTPGPPRRRSRSATVLPSRAGVRPGLRQDQPGSTAAGDHTRVRSVAFHLPGDSDENLDDNPFPTETQIEDADSAGHSNITTTAILLLDQDIIGTEGALRSMTYDNL